MVKTEDDPISTFLQLTPPGVTECDYKPAAGTVAYGTQSCPNTEAERVRVGPNTPCADRTPPPRLSNPASVEGSVEGSTAWEAMADHQHPRVDGKNQTAPSARGTRGGSDT